MANRRRYRKKADCFIIAVQLDLDTEGFMYNKWGSEQQCKKGDWLVNNDGDIYTVDQEVFTKTYRKIKEGIFVKSTPIWAEIATTAGSIETKEGRSAFNKGDYLVCNNQDGSDAYCISATKFSSMYEFDDE